MKLKHIPFLLFLNLQKEGYYVLVFSIVAISMRKIKLHYDNPKSQNSRQGGERIKKELIKFGGSLKSHIDPLEYQKKRRKEWDKK